MVLKRSGSLSLSLLLLACCWSSTVAPEVIEVTGKRIVGYVPEYRHGIEWEGVLDKLTDVILFSIEATETGELSNLDRLPSDLSRIQKLAKDRGTNVLICIGGGGRSQGLGATLREERSMKNLARNLIEFVRSNGLSGVDIDWEIPTSEGDYETLMGFCKALKSLAAKESEEFLVTVAIHPGQEMKMDPGIVEVADFISIMVYDNMCQQPRSAPPCYHSTLEFSQMVVDRLVRKGFARKALLGLPFYGRHVNHGEAKTYYELVDGARSESDDMVDEYYFNGINTMRSKIDLVFNSDLGGCMIWELGQDVSPSREDSLLASLASYVKYKATPSKLQRRKQRKERKRPVREEL